MRSRLLETHETILVECHDAAARIAEPGDNGTNDLLVSRVIRTEELRTRFSAEHLVDALPDPCLSRGRGRLVRLRCCEDRRPSDGRCGTGSG